MQIVKVNPAEFGIEETKAADISTQFKPMLDKMETLEKEYNEIIKLDIEDPQSAKKAKELRLKYVKVRTGTADIHKAQKAFYLSAGRYVDGWKNAQLFASQGIEEKLEAIEKYAENKEKERIAALQSYRENILSQYDVENISALNLGGMAESVWDNFLAGTKLSHENKIKAIREAEAEEKLRIELEEKEKELQQAENKRLKQEAAKREAEMQEQIAAADKERKRLEKENADKLAAIEKANKEAREKAAAEQKVRDDQARKEREAQQAALEEERRKSAVVAMELQKQKDASAKLEKDKQESAEAELSKGDSEKFDSFLKELESLKGKYQYKGKKFKALQSSCNELIDKTINYAISKI